jgi:predicted acylesterase/phospholipase RssA
MESITHVALSGGGMMGLVYTGVLSELRNQCSNIRCCAGTSIGALFAAAWALNISMDQLSEFVKTYSMKGYTLTLQSMARILDPGTFGIDDGIRLRTLVSTIIDPNLTFANLADARDLVICVTDVLTMTPYYISRRTHPNVCVLDAVMASMAIPGVFDPVQIDGKLYIDGGITDDIPLGYFDTEQVPHDAIFICHITNTQRLGLENMDSKVNYFSAVINALVYKMYYFPYIQTVYKNYLKMDACPSQFLPIRLIDDGIKIDVDEKTIEEARVYGQTSVAAFSLRIGQRHEVPGVPETQPEPERQKCL